MYVASQGNMIPAGETVDIYRVQDGKDLYVKVCATSSDFEPVLLPFYGTSESMLLKINLHKLKYLRIIMKLIRNSVFETNSSSCHSISVGKSDVYEGVTPDEFNEIKLDPIEFGWYEEEFDTPKSRMSYVFIYLRDWVRNEDKVVGMWETFNRVVKEHTGADKVYIQIRDSGYGDYKIEGYIDHQSVESNDLDYLFDNDATLKSFLFDSTSYILTDNDNH